MCSRQDCYTDPQHSTNPPVCDPSFPGTFLTLVGNPTESQSHHYTSGGLIEGVWTRGRQLGDCCVCVLQFRASGIEGEQSFENEESPSRELGTTGRPGGVLLKSATAGDTTDREPYNKHQCVGYHQPIQREESATRATTERD